MKKKKGRLSPKGVSPIDVFIGNRMRERRVQLNISLEALAADLGISFQQVQKYERGANRVSAARLFQICRLLDCSFSSMFERDPRNPH